MDLVQALVAVTQDVFSTMMTLSTTPGVPYQRNDEPFYDSISGVIHLNGKYTGMLAIHLPLLTALEVTGSFLDLEIHEFDEDVRDTIGELANILAGNLKAILDPEGSSIRLSLPTLHHGEEYLVESLPGTVRASVPFYLDVGDILIEIQLKTEG